MEKRQEHRILLMTDTASDISDRDLKKSGIVMLYIPMVIDGKGYLDRADFSIDEFYQKLEKARELPVTSHIVPHTYLEAYTRAFEDGYTDVINTTITSRASTMFQSAVHAKKQFFEKYPQAKDKFHIYVIDSGAYTMGYGYPLIEASKMIKAGKSVSSIIEYLDDFFSHYETIFAPYTLEYAKRSGRLPAAAAFIGEVLGLRPIITVIDGVTKVAEKVRGEKNIPARIAQLAYSRASDKKAPTVVAYGNCPEVGEQIYNAVKKLFGTAPKAVCQVGAAITINAGPRVVGMLVRGEKRLDTRAREQDFLI